MNVIVLIALLLVGCSVPRSPAVEPDAVVETPAEARRVALRFLARQPFTDEYDPETADALEDRDIWTVLVEHVDKEHRRPAYGVISVNKRTGKTAWLPMR